MDGNSTNGQSLIREERLLIFLYFAGGSSFEDQTAFTFNCSYGAIQGSIDICIQVCSYIIKIEEKFKYLSNNFNTRLSMMLLFPNIFGFQTKKKWKNR